MKAGCNLECLGDDRDDKDALKIGNLEKPCQVNLFLNIVKVVGTNI
jgi:hypothetical protein